MNRRIKRDVETSAEYILPDYMGDIKKILLCRQELPPLDSYVSADSLEVNGEVEYVIIYADADNRLGSINLGSSLSLTLCDVSDGYVGARIYSNVENTSLRVLGPRKISVRSNVSVNAIVTEAGGIEIGGDLFDSEEAVERSVELINAENNRYIEDKVEREIAEEIERIPGLSGEDIEIIGSGGTVKIEGARTTSSGVEISGELIITAIVKTPNQPPFRIVKSVPFSETVELELSEGEQMTPSVFISSLTLNERDDEEDKVIVANAILEIDLSLMSNVPVTIIKDAYLLNRESENVYSTLEYNTLLTSRTEGCSTEGKVSLSELGCDNIHGILASFVEIKDLSVVNDGGGAKICANVCFSGIACEINADESITYYSIKKSVPFEKNVNVGCQISEDMCFYPTVIDKNVDAFIDADNILIECSFDVNIDVVERERISYLSSSSITGEMPARTKATITVYYPSIGDTLFDIAKRHHTTVSKLCEDNSISISVSANDSSSLKDITKLIIK